MPILIFGHKNPDTDSVCSAAAFSTLKNRLGMNTESGVLGSINKESQYVLDYFNIPCPRVINDVKIQARDLDYQRVEGVKPERSILWCYKHMENNNLKTLAITTDTNELKGIITMKDIAMELIKGDYYRLYTSISNIVGAFGGKILCGSDTHLEGRIAVVAYDYESLKGKLTRDMIVIVGNRYDIIELAIDSRVKLIITTGDISLPDKYINKANKHKVPIVSVSTDTYTTAKLINQCNYVSTIMKTQNIVKFLEDSYLSDVKEEIINTSFRNYPVVDEHNKFLGFLGRRHVLNPGKKKVILVDHNEYRQSADGLLEAEILEIVDHHKLGDISTPVPISFRNIPVGSACTIIYTLYRQYGIEIDYKTAGLLISGIISDTLFLKSPTTTEVDRKALEYLEKILNIDLDAYSTGMFRAGTSLEGYSIKEIFFKDFKEFDIDKYKVGIAQVFTLDIESVFNRKKQFINFINKTHKNKEYFLTLLLVTDILKEGSYLLFSSKNNALISAAFGVEQVQGVYVENLVSRKKQVLPKIMEGINMLR